MRKLLAISVVAWTAGWSWANGSLERIGVSVVPLVPVVQAIVGDGVEVRALQEAGDACEVFEPRPSQLQWMAGAQVFFRVGMGFEETVVPRLGRQNSELRVVDLREGMELLPVAGGHVHDEHCEHESDAEWAADPHIWLDPLALSAMAGRIAEVLAELDGSAAGVYPERAAQVRARLAAVHAELEQLLQPVRGRQFLIYHPALGYFARRYGLEQVPIAGGSHGPSSRAMLRQLAEAREAGVRTIFVQPQESEAHAREVAAAIGAQVVAIDPLSADWEQNLLRIGRAMAGALAEMSVEATAADGS